jgi:hypothetical protein
MSLPLLGKTACALAVPLLLAGPALGSAAAVSNKSAPLKTHEVTVEIVSVDIDKNAITIKDETRDEHTWRVEGKAIADLKHLKPGDKVIITGLESGKGDDLSVILIKLSVLGPTPEPTRKKH